jgi:hypothetical protein
MMKKKWLEQYCFCCIINSKEDFIMDAEEYKAGQIYLNADGVTFRYIYKAEENYKGWLYIDSHLLGQDHHSTDYYDCGYCKWQRKHRFEKDIIREATPEEYQSLQPLVDKFNKDLEDNNKTERQKTLESYTDLELS